MALPPRLRTGANAGTLHPGTSPFIRSYICGQSRTAARKELLDQATSPDECAKLYEESLWCLYTLQDDLLQADNPFAEEDRTTINTCK
jgi:hypothetical protein